VRREKRRVDLLGQERPPQHPVKSTARNDPGRLPSCQNTCALSRASLPPSVVWLDSARASRTGSPSTHRMPRQRCMQLPLGSSPRRLDSPCDSSWDACTVASDRLLLSQHSYYEHSRLVASRRRRAELSLCVRARGTWRFTTPDPLRRAFSRRLGGVLFPPPTDGAEPLTSLSPPSPRSFRCFRTHSMLRGPPRPLPTLPREGPRLSQPEMPFVDR